MHGLSTIIKKNGKFTVGDAVTVLSGDGTVMKVNIKTQGAYFGLTYDIHLFDGGRLSDVPENDVTAMLAVPPPSASQGTSKMTLDLSGIVDIQTHCPQCGAEYVQIILMTSVWEGCKPCDKTKDELIETNESKQDEDLLAEFERILKD